MSRLTCKYLVALYPGWILCTPRRGLSKLLNKLQPPHLRSCLDTQGSVSSPGSSRHMAKHAICASPLCSRGTLPGSHCGDCQATNEARGLVCGHVQLNVSYGCIRRRPHWIWRLRRPHWNLPRQPLTHIWFVPGQQPNEESLTQAAKLVCCTSWTEHDGDCDPFID